jgi:outer membrane protein OmpA-like peptidoglycan-associated protein
MAWSGGSLAFCSLVLGLLFWPQPGAAQNFRPDDPIPPGAKGDVFTLKGEVLPLNATVLDIKGAVLDIKGIAATVAGRVDPLQAALKDLSATVTGKEIKIALAADVLFDFDKADLRPAARPELEKVAAVLKAYPKAAITIEGHTDGKGNDQYNQRLSERRAESVRRWLAENGISTPMTARGFGKTKPVAPNTKPDGADDPEGRQKNRRVEITVKT